jgi:hypothetical protein
MKVTGNEYRLPKGISRAMFHCFLGSLLLLNAGAWGAQNPDLTVVGPVEAANCVTKTVRVLGITYQVASSQAFAELCSLGSAAGYKYISISGIAVGTAQANALHWSLIESEPYVPGVSNVYVLGRVSSLNSKTGEFRIAGSPTNFFTGALPSANEFVEVLGTQPSPKGVVLASSVSSRVSADGIIGSGITTNGIIGSGNVTSGIIGSGKSTEGIIGSGKATAGIIGSGIATSGIIGSGQATDGIIGSGKSTDGIIGSGKATSGIIGSGLATNGIIGSGKTTSGIIGSGVNTDGIIGSGVTTNGIIGSGKSAQ